MRVKDLTAPPSFLRGMARALDLGATLDESEVVLVPGNVADMRALAGDWRRVGEDLRSAMDRARKENTALSAG